MAPGSVGGAAFAGTALEPARALVEKLLLEVLECRNVLADIRALVAGFAVDVVIVERMVGICAMALGCIMSGMGDLRTFKLLRCAVECQPGQKFPRSGACRRAGCPASSPPLPTRQPLGETEPIGPEVIRTSNWLHAAKRVA